MASFISSGNAIVVYLNARKREYRDVGQFVVSTEELTEELTKEYNAIQQATKAGSSVYNSVYAAAEKSSSNIKLIILELKNRKLTLDCDAFLLDADRMNEQYIESLNHVIIGKMGDAYAIIGYVENPNGGTKSRPPIPCTTFKLQKTKSTGETCVLLPGIIKETIYKCVNAHYAKKIPDPISVYYEPTSKTYNEEVVAETKVEADLAAAEAAVEITDADKCDFKTLLKSKIKNESNEYCKVTDPGLLERIKQNIDGDGVDVNVDGLNELINTRIKKVTDEGEEEEDEEEKEREDGKKTISENKEATMIREANEMFMISRKVLSKGATYSSSEFFKEYLPTNTIVTEKKEKEPENPVAAPTVIEAPVAPAATTTDATAVTAASAAAAGPAVTEAPAPATTVTATAEAEANKFTRLTPDNITKYFFYELYNEQYQPIDTILSVDERANTIFTNKFKTININEGNYYIRNK